MGVRRSLERGRGWQVRAPVAPAAPDAAGRQAGCRRGLAGEATRATAHHVGQAHYCYFKRRLRGAGAASLPCRRTAGAAANSCRFLARGTFLVWELLAVAVALAVAAAWLAGTVAVAVTAAAADVGGIGSAGGGRGSSLLAALPARRRRVEQRGHRCAPDLHNPVNGGLQRCVQLGQALPRLC